MQLSVENVPCIVTLCKVRLASFNLPSCWDGVTVLTVQAQTQGLV